MPDSNATTSQKIPESALPRNDQDLRDWLRLIRSRRVGPATFIRLMREYGNASAALDALPAIASNAGVKDYVPCTVDAAMHEFKSGTALGAQLIALGAPDYPPLLALIDDAPPMIWALGDTKLAAKRCIGLVGARNASSLGRRMAARLAGELAEAGYVVVSGLARGIDAEAHQASLSTGTIAVHAGGVDNIYPQENTELARAILEKGLRISEMPIGTQPQARHFPRRNRIISGLCTGIVVIEGAVRSGSLITAKDALDQGREVMAVPGHPLDSRAGGCNQLIRDGAIMVRSTQDILNAIGDEQAKLPAKPSPKKQPETHSNSDTIIMSLLSPTPAPEDLIIRQCGLPIHRAMAALGTLELDNRIQRHPGGLVSLSQNAV